MCLYDYTLIVKIIYSYIICITLAVHGSLHIFKPLSVYYVFVSFVIILTYYYLAIRVYNKQICRYYVAGFLREEISHKFHECIAIYENFILKMFTKEVYQKVLLTICETFPPQKVGIGPIYEKFHPQKKPAS